VYSNRAKKSEFRNGRRQAKKKEENGFQYPVKGIAKIRILARFMSMVIICEESSVYKGCKSGKSNLSWEGESWKGRRARRRARLAFEVLPKNIPYENKTNKSRASDVYVMGNEIGC